MMKPSKYRVMPWAFELIVHRIPNGTAFDGVEGEVTKPSWLQSGAVFDDPLPFFKSSKVYPLATKQLLASEDSAFFLAISQRAREKPVHFVPFRRRSHRWRCRRHI